MTITMLRAHNDEEEKDSGGIFTNNRTRKVVADLTRSIVPKKPSTEIELFDSVLVHLQDFIDSPSKDPDDLSSAQGKISEAIMELNLIADLEKGIQSTYEEIEVNQQPVRVLYRDAREYQPISKYAYAHWAIMGLNYINATIKLVELLSEPAGKLSQEGRLHFSRLAQKFVTQLRHSKDPENEYAHMPHAVLIPYLIKMLPHYFTDSSKAKKQAKQLLEEVRDFGNFEQPVLVVATRTLIKQVGENKPDVEHLNIDVPMTGSLTKTQKQQYQTLKPAFPLLEEKDEKSVSVEDEKVVNEISWYAEQSSHIKKFIRHHAEDVLAGRMVSTQLRDAAASVRNGGHEFVYLKTADAKEDFTCHFEAYHSGNPSHEFKDTDADKENISQLDQLIGAEHLTFCDLTTNAALPGAEGGEDGVNQRTPAAINETKSKNFSYANLTAHAFRLFINNQYHGVESIIDQAEDIVNYVTKRNPLTSLDIKIQGELDRNPPSKEMIERIETLIKLFKKIQRDIGQSLTDRQNDNLTLAALAALLTFNMNQTLGRTYIAIVIFCKSGKDRAGLLRLIMNIQATVLALTNKNIYEVNPEQLKYIVYSLTRANQIGAQAALSSNILGAFGVLESIDKAALPDYLSPKQDKNISKISDRKAKLGKKIPDDPTQMRFYKKPKFWMGVGAVILGAALCASGMGVFIGIPIIAGAITACSMGIGALAGYGYLKKKKKNSSRLLKISLLLFGLGLCATGIGALAGVPILAGIAAGMADNITGLSLIFASIVTGKKAINENKSALRMISISTCLLGIALCLTGVGAIVGAPILATSLISLSASTGGLMMAISNLRSSFISMDFKKDKARNIVLAVGGLLIGAALCATGAGALFGAPMIVASIATVTAGIGAMVCAAPIITSKNTPLWKKVAAGAGALIGVALILTGVGAIAGIPILSTLGFLRKDGPINMANSHLSQTTVVATGSAATAGGLSTATKQIKKPYRTQTVYSTNFTTTAQLTTTLSTNKPDNQPLYREPSSSESPSSSDMTSLLFDRSNRQFSAPLAAGNTTSSRTLSL